MAGSGPPPQEQRHRRAKPVRGDWKRQEVTGWKHGKVPRPPTELQPATRAAWKTWFGSWFAAFWAPDDVPGLRVVAQLYDAVEHGESQRAAELRMWLDGYGITPKGQQDRRWQRPAPPPPPNEHDQLPRDNHYRRLRVTDEGPSVKERFAALEADT